MKNSTSKWDSSWSAYDYYTRVHQIAFGRDQYGHNRWSFLPWHRAFLQLFESEVREYYVGENPDKFYLPYWDPTNELSTYDTVLDLDFIGGDGDPLGGWDNNEEMTLSCSKWPLDPRLPATRGSYNHSCLSRRVGQGTVVILDDNTTKIYGESLPDKNAWYSAIYDEKLPYDVPPYLSFNFTWEQHNNSFRARIEGVNPELIVGDMTHGLLHNYVGGHIIEPTSPNDPIFFLLHGWIDLMWALYQDQWGDYAFDTFPEQFLDVAYFQENNDFEWFNNSQYTSRDVMDHRKMGYIYDLQMEDEANNEDDEWYDNLMNSPGFEIWISLIALVVVCVMSYCCLRFYRKRSADSYRQFK